MEKLLILSEDDCAPDAREYFEKEFKEILGMSIKEFEKKATRIERDEGRVVEYWLGKYMMDYSADHPFYSLYDLTYLYKVGKAATIHNFEQQTDEWYNVRIGKFTASKIKTLMVKGKGVHGLGKGAITWLMENVAEILTGTVERFSAAATEWGNEHEDEARRMYEWRTGNVTEQVGFVECHKYFGVSPDCRTKEQTDDGWEDGCTEIKCPYDFSKLLTYRTLNTPELIAKECPEYYAQVQAQMFALNVKWCDLVFFDTRYPREICMHIVRIPRNQEFIDDMVGKLTIAIEYMIELVSQLKPESK